MIPVATDFLGPSFATLAVLALAFAAAQMLAPQAGFSTRGILAATLAYAGLSIALQILGAVGWLHWQALAALAGFAVVAALVLARPFITATSAAKPLNPWPARLGGVVLGLLLLCMYRRLTAWPVQAVSDGPIYHLPLALQWWQSGRLEYIATPFGELGATYFPANGDLWYTWLIALSGRTVAAKLGQLPFLAWLALAVYALARRLGAERVAAMLAAGLVVASPLVRATAAEPLVDIPFAACLVSAAAFLASGAGEGPRVRLLGIGLALGAALGTKTVGLAFAPLIFLPALCLLRTGRRLRDFAWLFVPMLLPCAFWYGLNWWKCGNPLYPLHVTLAGIEVFPGWYDSATMKRTSGYHLPEGDRGLLAFSLQTVIGEVVRDRPATWAMPGLWALGMLAAACSRQWLWPLGVVVAFATYWHGVPYNSQFRFLIPAWCVGAALLALPLARWRWLRTVCGVAIGGLVAMALANEWRAIPTPLKGGPMWSFLDDDAIEGRAAPAWAVLERTAPPHGVTVAYCGTNLSYYLFGSSHRNKVVYCNVQGPAEWLPHDFHRERLRQSLRQPHNSAWPQWHRDRPDYDQWRRNLDTLKVDYVFAARENWFARPNPPAAPQFTIEYEWMMQRPETFQRVGPPPDRHGEPWAVVFLVKRK